MATTDQVNMQLFHRLKLKFPEIPDGVIMSCIHKFPNDPQNCTAYLTQLSGNYLYGSATELALNKQDKDHYNHYETTRLYHPQLPPNTVNNRPPTPRYLMQKSLPCDVYYSPAMPNYSGSPSMMRPGGGYQLQRPPLEGQAQSAPVMPISYEPFLAESFNKVSMGGGAVSPVPHHSPSQMGMPALVPGGAHHLHHHHQHHAPPPYMQNDYESQQRRQFNQYDWEMHVSYNQGMCGTSGSYSLSSSIHQHPRKVQAYPEPPPSVRHVTSLNINPVGPHVGLFRLEPRYVVPASSTPAQQQPLHSTTVNLRLQPPSPHPQPRVQINTSGGGNVVYSASPGQTPTKSHFHFSFNPSRGGSFAAMRTRSSPRRAAMVPQCSVDVRPATPTSQTSPPPSLPAAAAVVSSTSLSFHSSSSSYSATNVLSGSVTVSTTSNSSSLLRGKSTTKREDVDDEKSTSSTLFDRTNPDQLEISEVPIRPTQPPPETKLTTSKLQLDLNSKLDNPGSPKGFDECNGEVAYVQALVLHQRAQMSRLQQKLNEDRQFLDCMRNDVSSLEVQMYNRVTAKKHPAPFNLDEIKKLREETRQLRVDCYCMTRELEFLTSSKKTNNGFYGHINPGQSGSIGASPTPSPSIGHMRVQSPPPSSGRRQETDEDDHQWSCSTCTFLNNPALDKCEICEMPRLMLGMPHSHSSFAIKSGPCYCHRQSIT